jgi:hypothetical protein
MRNTLEQDAEHDSNGLRPSPMLRRCATWLMRGPAQALKVSLSVFAGSASISTPSLLRGRAPFFCSLARFYDSTAV